MLQVVVRARTLQLEIVLELGHYMCSSVRGYVIALLYYIIVCPNVGTASDIYIYIYIEREREKEIDTCMHIYIYIYIYTCVCIYIYIYIIMS